MRCWALSPEYWSWRGAESALRSPWTSALSHAAAQTRVICMAFGSNLATNIDPDLCCCIAMNPDMALSGRTGQDLIMASSGRTGYSHQAVPLSALTSLHIAQALPLLFPSHLFTTYCTTKGLLLWAGHMAGWPLGVFCPPALVPLPPGAEGRLSFFY